MIEVSSNKIECIYLQFGTQNVFIDFFWLLPSYVPSPKKVSEPVTEAAMQANVMTLPFMFLSSHFRLLESGRD